MTTETRITQVLKRHDKKLANVDDKSIVNKATLSLDFASNDHKEYQPFGLTPTPLTSAITTTRTSEGTYITPMGTIATAPANVPRITYGENGEALGLLCEEQRTNLIVNNENLAGSAWVRFNITPINNFTSTPNGLPATRLNAVPAGNDPRIDQTISLTIGVTYTFRFSYRRALIGKASRLQYYSPSSLSNTIISATDNWQTFQETFTATSSTLFIRFRTPTLSEEMDIVVGELQLEEGSLPTSYIKTEASQVTRVADSYVRNLVNFNPDAYCFLINFKHVMNDSSTRTLFLVRRNATFTLENGNSLQLNITGNELRTTRFRRDAGASFGLGGNLMTVGEDYTVAVQWVRVNGVITGHRIVCAKLGINYSINESTSFPDGNTTQTVMDQIIIGRRANNTNFANQAVKSIIHIPSTFTEAQLLEITR
jgi:hypothetical protein